MLTDKGVTTLTELKRLVSEHDNRVTACLAPEERVQLNSLLLRLYQS